MDEGLSPRAQEPRRPLESAGSPGIETLPTDGSRDSLVLQVLSTEHFSLLSQRGLVYNEAFTRVGMLLTFVSMSLVALALLSSALPAATDLVVIAIVVLGFDLIVGLATVIRVRNAYQEDFTAVQAMNRVRHGYVELAPEVMPYLSTGVYDDVSGVGASYGTSIVASSTLAGVAYGFSTSIGLAMLVVALLTGALVAVGALAIGVSGGVALAAGAAAALVAITALAWVGYRTQVRSQADLVVRFPPPEPEGPGARGR
jgi:hypothetical protein